MNKLILIVFILIDCVRSEPILPSIAGKLSKVIFLYPTGVQSERNLNVCLENSACNIIYKRFWLPPLVERLCKCPQRQECRWMWTEKTDNYTMSLDNRSQIKFCQQLEQLPKCTIKKPGIKIIVDSPNQEIKSTAAPKFRNSFKTNRRPEPKNVTALCNCQDPHYWKLKINSTKYDENNRKQQTYFCSKLKKCTSLEFCGHVRTDTYSTFYRCSCPKGHLCITQDKTMFNIEELLYNGFGYKAFCLPVKHKVPNEVLY